MSQNLSKNGKSGTVELANVSKSFRRRSKVKSYSTIKSSLIEKFFRSDSGESDEFLALDGLSATVKPGCSLGVIGRNGSGKSTLLKLISGIYLPDGGTVETHGRISALIELGAGFHPDFTGRENLVLGGVMYGLTKKEIEARADKIIEYAQLKEFIDEPVRTYSSGMYMRLGFSLAVHTEPDILLVDEVLAVGDAAFIHRCQETISELKRKGTTLIFVTHDLNSVERWCDEAIWLSSGKVKERGEPRFVIDSYLSDVEKAEEEALEVSNSDTAGTEAVVDEPEDQAEENPKRWGSGQVEISDVKIFGSDGNASWLFHQDEKVTIQAKYSIKQPISALVFGIGILRLDGLCLHGTNTDIESIDAPLPSEEELAAASEENPIEGTLSYTINSLQMLEGSYHLDIAAHKPDGAPYDYHHELYKFSVRSKIAYHGVYVPDHSWSFAPSYKAVKKDKSDSETASVRRA